MTRTKQIAAIEVMKASTSVLSFGFWVLGLLRPKNRNSKPETSRPSLVRSILAALPIALGIGVPVASAQDYAYEKSAAPKAPVVAVPLTPEEKAQLAAVDARFAALEALVGKIDEPGYKATTLSAIADIKKRRAALEKKFDPASYETLMHLVIGRYQVVSLWLKPPRIPATERKSEDKPASQ